MCVSWSGVRYSVLSIVWECGNSYLVGGAERAGSTWLAVSQCFAFDEYPFDCCLDVLGLCGDRLLGVAVLDSLTLMHSLPWQRTLDFLRACEDESS